MITLTFILLIKLMTFFITFTIRGMAVFFKIIFFGPLMILSLLLGGMGPGPGPR